MIKINKIDAIIIMKQTLRAVTACACMGLTCWALADFAFQAGATAAYKEAVNAIQDAKREW